MAIQESRGGLADSGRSNAGNVAEAKANPGGWVYQIAGSFGPTDHIPPEFIKGAFKVDERGNITGEFQANPKYRGEP